MNLQLSYQVRLKKKFVNDFIHGIDYLLFLGVPYPENLLPDPEMINLSDEEDEEKGNFDEKVNLFGEYQRSRFKERLMQSELLVSIFLLIILSKRLTQKTFMKVHCLR